MQPERLQKIIAHAGFASRREAETMIREGRVTVNGRVVTELGSKADAERDHIKVDGKLILEPEAHRYILLYKPKEVMTTVEDPQGRKTVIDLVRGIRERIYPVGRLDFHSEGLVLLTNDGELAFKVSHPKHGSVKTYHVKVRGIPVDRLIEKLQRGITLDGKRTLPCEIERLKTTGRTEDEGNSWFEVKLREGRTQQIRKMFQAVGHPVAKLRRVAIGPLADPKLTPGVWRELTPKEVKLLNTQQEAVPIARKTRPATRKPEPPRRKKAPPKDAKAPAKSGARATKAAATKARATSARPAAARVTATRTTTSRPASSRPATSRATTSRPTTSRSAAPRTAKSQSAPVRRSAAGTKKPTRPTRSPAARRG
jgi:23S rRNA pseudouridine2605 synthase